MADQIKISELPIATTGSGYVPIVQAGTTKQYDLSNKLDSANIGTVAPAYWNTAGTKTFTNMRGMGHITNGSKSLEIWFPYASAYSGTYTYNAVSIVPRFISGYGYARSGSSGGTYTQLSNTTGGMLSIWNNSASVRANEVSAIAGYMITAGFIYIRIDFVYALTQNNTGTVIVNNSPVSVIATFTMTRS